MAPGAPPTSVPHFAYTRNATDRKWLLVYAAFWAVCLAGAVYGALNRNPLAFAPKDDASLCPSAAASRRSGRALLAAAGGPPAYDVLSVLPAWLAISSLGTLGVGFAYLYLFQRHSTAMTNASIGVQIALPIAIGLGCFAAGANDFEAGNTTGIVLFVYAGIAALVFFCWRHHIPLAASLLRVSANGLAANPGLIPTAILLNIASLLAVAPLGLMAVLVAQNGELVPNPQRLLGAAECIDIRHRKVDCCDFQQDGWAIAYLVLPLSITFVWTLLLANQIRVFVTSGTVAQWYFSPPGTSTRGTTLRSLKFALGPALGTLLFSSAVLTLVSFLRGMARSLRRNSRGAAAIIAHALAFVLELILSAVEYLTKFATVMAAITGEPLAVAGRNATALLARNMLETFVGTIWFAPLVIRLAAFGISLGWGLCNADLFFLHLLAHNAVDWDLILAVGLVTFVISFFVLSFLGGVLLSVLDAAFMCYALDRDSQTVSQQEFYEAFMAVPLKPAAGAVVENPEGGLAFGAQELAAAPPPAGHAVGAAAGVQQAQQAQRGATLEEQRVPLLQQPSGEVQLLSAPAGRH